MIWKKVSILRLRKKRGKNRKVLVFLHSHRFYFSSWKVDYWDSENSDPWWSSGRVQVLLLGGNWGAPLFSFGEVSWDVLGQLSKVTKFGLCCFSMFSFQCVMRTFQVTRNDFLAGLYLPVSGNSRQVFQQRILTMAFLLCGVTSNQCWFSGQKWFKYSCFWGGKGYGGSD